MLRSALLCAPRTALGLAVLASAPLALAQTSPDPAPKSPLELPGVAVPTLQLDALAAEDIERERLGLPPRYAQPFAVALQPADSGTWDAIDDTTLRWRLRVEAPGARSINLGFGEFRLPEGAELRLLPVESEFAAVGPFTADDNAAHGELWTPIVPGAELVVELRLPLEAFDDFALKLTQVGSGYRGLGAGLPGTPALPVSGSCNVDVVCPEGVGWEGEIASVGVISTGGSTNCTGFMVNNTANDQTPYFMTADHCGVGPSNAASLVVYWNYETSTCGATPNGQLNQFNSGSFFRAANSASDFTLVELDSDPDPAWEVTYAGWDRSGAEASTAIAIHHPQTDEKRISFEFQSTDTTGYLGGPGSGTTHVRVLDWDIGTTEPGSSGSPLFDQNHRVIGQLHGGYAACGNNDEDWYGRISASWNGGSASTRLRDWLDPGNTGAVVVDTLGVGLAVAQDVPAQHEGPILGPLSNPSVAYTLTNKSMGAINYRLSLGTPNPGLLLNGGGAPIQGNLAPNVSVSVTVALSSDAALLPAGEAQGALVVEDLTNGITSDRLHKFDVGRVVAYDFPFDTDPGWTAQGVWNFGVPLGNAGDPSSGSTGQNVYGYNLGGAYTSNLPARDLISDPLDLSGMLDATLEFQRWLGVETSVYDNADVFFSTDSVTRTVLWQNGGTMEDSAWVPMSLDLAAAVGEPSVYLGWRMGATDGSVEYGGWNVDDVRITGRATFTPYGSACAGSTPAPSLDGSGQAVPGGAISLDLAGGLPGGQAFVFFAREIQISPLAGCQVLIGAVSPNSFAGVLDGSGALGFPIALPNFLNPGDTFFLQGLGVDFGAPNGLFSLTNALQLTVR